MAPTVVFYCANCTLAAVVHLSAIEHIQTLAYCLVVQLCLKSYCRHCIITAVVHPPTKSYACYGTAVVLKELRAVFLLQL